MKNRWIMASSLAAEVLAFVLALFLAGGGDGTYYAAKCLFPYTMISTGFRHAITLPSIALACIQFPLYGGLLCLGNSERKARPVAFGILAVHLIATWFAFLFSGAEFYP